MSSRVSTSRPTSAGALVREWRAARRLSQLDLALDAGISPRHLSCVETGKAQPSRELIVRLAETLEIPLRERNALLKAAGYAAIYPESELTTPQLAQVRRAIDAILEHQEPYPAFVLDRRWNIVMANQAAVRVNGFLLDGRHSPHSNMIRHFFDPGDLRAAVANWEEVAGDLIRHLHGEARTDAQARALLDEVLAYPDVPSRWRTPELRAVPAPLLTVVFRHKGRELRFFSTITTFGTPRDVTLDELHIECTFPLDEATAEFCRSLARTARERDAAESA
jgi:transcriptional regulator with XRE-family HTH domain